MSPRTNAELAQEVLAREAVGNARTVAVLGDPEFIEGGRVGFEEEKQGLGIPLAEARRRAAEVRKAAKRA